ncbi:MAG: PQQ-binding-like beta-propeller repeat protein [Pirellulales bacterium]
MRTAVPVFVTGLILWSAGVVADDWPQWRGPRRDGVWRETGIVARLPAQLHRRWQTPIGAGFSGPAVAGTRLFVTDRIAPKGQAAPKNRAMEREELGGRERVLCLDAETGRIVWEHSYRCQYKISYPVGPRATPTVHDGKVYTLGAMGDLLCLDSETGRLLWKKNYTAEFGTEMNLWGMAAAPLVHGDKLVILVGGKNGAGVVALDRETGDELWRALEGGDPGYAAPVIVHAGGREQLIVWNPVGIHGLDPKAGTVYWREAATIHMGHSIATPIFDPKLGRLFVASFFDGPMMLELAEAQPTAKLLWRGTSHSELPANTEGLHSLLSTPAFKEGYLFGICSYGQLRCLDAATGERLWETIEATGRGRWWNAFLIRHEDRFLIFNEQGELIIAQLSPKGYRELSRAFLIEPTSRVGRRKVVWSHPAFAHRCVFARNDKEIVCIDLAAD